ncbi:Ribosome-binding factor A [Azospirillaceae bacterium]
MTTRFRESARTARTPSQRQLRVGEALRHALSDFFLRADFRDPALQNLNVTVTEVRISPDLRNATAFVTPLGGGQSKETVAALRRASAFIRGQIAGAVQLRLVPTLSFEVDASFDRAARITTLLHAPEVVRDLDGNPVEQDAQSIQEEETIQEGQEGES